jgi:hypothetical protein
MKIRKNLWMNKLALILLRKALQFYRTQSKPLVNSLDAEVAWVSGIDSEEKHLDNTQRIIERRLRSAINKPSSR